MTQKEVHKYFEYSGNTEMEACVIKINSSALGFEGLVFP